MYHYYCKVWLLGASAYIFQRNVLLNLTYLLRACAYMEYCRKVPLLSLTYKTVQYRCQKWIKLFVVSQRLTEDSYTISIWFHAWFCITKESLLSATV